MYLQLTDILCSKFLIVLFVIYFINNNRIEAGSRIIATFNSRTKINNLIVLENSGKVSFLKINFYQEKMLKINLINF